jgi:hypothetical protein
MKERLEKENNVEQNVIEHTILTQAVECTALHRI